MSRYHESMPHVATGTDASPAAEEIRYYAIFTPLGIVSIPVVSPTIEPPPTQGREDAPF